MPYFRIRVLTLWYLAFSIHLDDVDSRELSGSIISVHCVPICRICGLRSLPTSLSFLDHHHRLRCQSPFPFGSKLFSVCRSGCRVIFHPISSTFRVVLGISVYAWCDLPPLVIAISFCSCFRSETKDPKTI